MQPQLLLVEGHWIMGITEKERILDKKNPKWGLFETGMISEELMGKDE